MNATEHEALAEAHRRLRIAAAAVVEHAAAAGDSAQPMCKVEPHLIRTLRRELAHEPQPQGMKYTTMSIT